MKKKYEKQILRYGTWNHPRGVLKVTKDFGEKLVSNFTRTPFAPVLRGHASDEEANKNPFLIVNKNISGLELKDDGVYAQLEVEESELDKYNDVSASIDPSYEDHETGEALGPVLKHVALVTNPFIKKLNPFVSLNDKGSDYLILLSDIKMESDNKEVSEVEASITEVKEKVEESTVVEESTDAKTEEAVVVATEETKSEEVQEEISEDKVQEEVKPAVEVTIDASEKSNDSDALRKKLEQMEIELSEARNYNKKLEAENFYSELLKQGKALPAFKNEIIELASISNETINLSDGGTKTIKQTLDSLFAKMPTLINLSEKGVDNNANRVELADISTPMVEGLKVNYFKDNPKATEDDFLEYVEAHKDIIKKNDKF